MNDMEDVIEAFVDDERVDVEQLKRALELPEGRAYLVDLLVMRDLVAASPARLVPLPAPPSRWSRASLTVAAAMVLVVSGIAGFTAGSRLVPPSAPPATFVIDTAAPPPPTTVIRLESGVDWTERTQGGN